MAVKTIIPGEGMDEEVKYRNAVGAAVHALNAALTEAGGAGLEVQIMHDEPFDAKVPSLSALVSKRLT